MRGEIKKNQYVPKCCTMKLKICCARHMLKSLIREIIIAMCIFLRVSVVCVTYYHF